jgi:hypothetical protein
MFNLQKDDFPVDTHVSVILFISVSKFSSQDIIWTRSNFKPVYTKNLHVAGV